jgi:hypothetical protein
MLTHIFHGIILINENSVEDLCLWIDWLFTSPTNNFSRGD